MKLAVFDLDGTLTKTFAVDGQYFLQAFSDALGINTVSSNWTKYEHVTDSGVIREVFGTNFGRQPKPDEISRFVECFVGLLSYSYGTSPDGFGEVAGAKSLLESLREDSEWRPAIATGSWERSARFKIKAAGLGADELPAAFAEDGPSREAIVQAAIARAAASYEQQVFEKVVSVGDAVWAQAINPDTTSGTNCYPWF